MGGKSSQSTQQVQIPPEVLARYNAVNARAETAAATPFQQYSTDPNAFVAPLTPTQQAGIANTNYYSQAAQPYYGAATEQLAQGIGTGGQYVNAATGTLQSGQTAAAPLQQQAATGYQQAYGAAQPFNQAAMQQYYQGVEQGRGLTGLAAAGTSNAYSGAQPFQDLATGYLLGGSQAVNPSALGSREINQYMSPYLSSVLGSTAALQNQMNQQAMSGQTGNAIRQGAFGGDRAGIAAANLAQQQQLANAKTFSDILNQGYGQALGTAQQQQQLGLGAEQANRAALQQAAQQSLGIGQQAFGQGLSAAQQQAALGQQLYGMGAGTGQNIAGLGQQVYGQGTGTAQQQAALGQQLFGQGLSASQQQAALGQQQFNQALAASQQLAALGQGKQGSALQGAQAQLAAGQAQQQTQQAGLQALYNQFLQEKSYPFQTAQFLANIAEGTGALSGSTTTTNQAMGGFSDKRLKENVRPIGKTFDGQNIYSYNFKGSPQTEIGLIAQEVEKHHPEAVGLAGGYKTVRYDKATDEAADRGHFAGGGAAMGGGVLPTHAGEGFFDGGFVGFDPGLMQQIMSSYQQMYAPLAGGAAGGAGGGLAGAGYVPQANSPVGQLMTAGDLPSMPSQTDNLQKMANLGSTIGELGGKAGAWKWNGQGDDKSSLKRDLKESMASGQFDTNTAVNNQKGLAGGTNDTSDTLKDIERPDLSAEARGGRIGLAAGGSPESSIPTKLDIPDDQQKHELMKPADAPNPPKDNTADTMATMAKIAMMMAAARGGRIGYADGGMPYGGMGLNIPDEKGPQANKLMTAGDAPGALKDNTGNVLGGVGDLVSLIPGGGAIGKGIGAVGKIFSDKRVKENIKPVGKTFDGQTVYSYNYKGDHQTRMGLIAQEVEKHHPDAVGSHRGIKTVDYKKATGLAAHRGHFAEGGEAEMSDFSPISGIQRGLDPMNRIKDILSMSPDESLISAPPVAENEGVLQRAVEAPRKKAGLAAAMPSQTEDKPFASPIVSRGGEGPRSVRNNNPGNIEDGPFARRLPGYVGSDGRFAVFKAPDYGRDAQIALISSYIKRGYDTPAEIAHRWAPGSEEGNNPNSYASVIARRLGIGVNDRVPASGIPLIADAQTIVEGGPKALQHFSGGYARGGYAVGGGGGLLPEDIQALARSEDEDSADTPERNIAGLGAGSAPPTAEAAPVSNVKLPTAPSGLAAGAPSQLALTSEPAPEKKRGFFGNIAHGDFVSGLGAGKATSWIPLLTGLATWGTTPTRSAISGALAGLGAGAQAAQAQREFGRQQKETGIRQTQAETQRMQIPISQQIADAQTLAAKTQNTSALEALRGNRVNIIRQLEATGQNIANNPAYIQAQAELRAIEKAISDVQKLGVKPTEGNRQFLGNVSDALSDSSKAQRLALGLGISGLPGAEIPAGVASAARDTGKIITPSGIQEVPGYTGTQSNITASVQGAGEATTDNKNAYQATQENWHEVQTKVIPVLQQLPANLPETGLGGSALSKLASAVRVLASTQGYDASGINGDDPRSVINAAGDMLGVAVNADNPTAAVKTILSAMKARIRQISNAARASGEWAKENTNPITGRVDYSRGNVTERITKAMGQ